MQSVKVSINLPKNPKNPNVVFKQISNAVGFYLISPNGKLYHSNSGLNCVSWFVFEIFNLEQMASECFKTNIPISGAKDCNTFVMSPEEEEHFEESTTCWVCDEP